MPKCAGVFELHHQRGLLLTQNQLLSASNPVQTFEDYKALPKKHRENIVNKRLRTMGIERGMRIPDSGDIVRSYNVYNDKSAHVSTLTLTKVDHLAGKCEVEDLFNTKAQTKISTIAAHLRPTRSGRRDLTGSAPGICMRKALRALSTSQTTSSKGAQRQR